MEHSNETLVSCNYTIWYRLYQFHKWLNPTGGIPFYLIGKPAFIVKYSDGTKSKVKLT